MNSIIPRLFQQQQKIIKFLIIVGVLLFSLVVGQVIPAKYLAYLLVLIVAFGVFLVYIRYAQLGLLAVFAGGMLVNFELGTSTSTSINLAVILLPLSIGVWFVDRFVRQRQIHFISSRTNPPLITLVIVSLLAFGIGQLTWFYYARQAPLLSQLGGLGIFILSAGAFIFTANVIDSLRWLKILTWMFVALGALFVISRVNVILGSTMEGILPAGATGSVFWIWMLAITYSQFLYNRDLKLFWRAVVLGLAAATLFVAMYLGYGWKSGWIPPLVAVGVITWLRFRRLRYVLTAGGLIVVWMIASELIQSDQYSYVTRLEAWKILLNEIIKVNPVFGLGPANYRFYTPLFPIMGYWVEFNSHNNYIDIIAQIGILGLIAILWFAWEEWRLGWGMLKKNLGGFGNAYVVGAMGGLVGMLVAGMLGDWVIPFVYNVGLKGFRASVLGWIFLGGLVALQHIKSTTHGDGDKDPD
jgi:hypothetical protein